MTTTNVEFVEIHVAHGTDSNGFPAEVLGYYSKPEDAEQAIKGRGYYGADGVVKPHPAVVINEHCYLLAQPTYIDLDFAMANKADVRRKALLSTLSEEDKQLLGVKG